MFVVSSGVDTKYFANREPWIRNVIRLCKIKFRKQLKRIKMKSKIRRLR